SVLTYSITRLGYAQSRSASTTVDEPPMRSKISWENRAARKSAESILRKTSRPANRLNGGLPDLLPPCQEPPSHTAFRRPTKTVLGAQRTRRRQFATLALPPRGSRRA